jgi:DUF971 family protein
MQTPSGQSTGRYKPKNITVESKKQFMSIDWGDGHRSVYSFEGLRANCPCVFCRGGHDKMGQPFELALFMKKPQRERKIVKMVPSGNYGIQIHWEDGHNTGIYKWESLRDVCPVENGLIDADQYD